MKFLKSPLGVTLIFFAAVIALQFTDYAETMLELAIFVSLAMLTFFIHEVGHTLFGVLAGYRFHYLIAGPFLIEKTDKIKVRANESWAMFGGVASCSPVSEDVTKIIKQHQWFAGGGPLVSLLTAIIALSIGFSFDQAYIKFFGILNLAIFAVTIIPFKGAMKSDGRVLLELRRGGKEAEAFLGSLLLLKEMMSPKHPADWSASLIEQTKQAAVSEDTIMNSYLLFYYYIVMENYDYASRMIEAYKTIPIRKDNKIAMQFITHIRQVDCFLHQPNAEEIKALHTYLSPIESVSYKRSEWMIAHLSGDHKTAETKRKEVYAEIEKGKKQFGFFYAEELLTHTILEAAKEPVFI